MNKIFNLTSTFKALEDDDGGVVIRGMASTMDVDRAGDIIDASAWAKGGLKNFENNPIILFNHDYNKPIGRATAVKAMQNGLELEAKISKAAPDSVAQLIKDGVLGAFSVGFRVKDADYIEETDGLKIKDAELFEVSVVSVPCNQGATFSLAKSFDSEKEYEDFKKHFNNRVDLAGQSLAEEEAKASGTASDAPKRDGDVQKEIKMDKQENNTPAIDLDAIAAKAAEKAAEAVATRMAMKQAEEKAAAEKAEKEAEEKAAAEKAEADKVETVIKTGIESGVDRLMADIEKASKDETKSLQDQLMQFKSALEEKSSELEAMRNSKAIFADRNSSESERIEKYSKDLKNAHIVGTILGNKGFDTEFGREVLEKAGVTYTAGSVLGIDNVVSRVIEEEIKLELRTAALFEEMRVESQSTVIPLQTDSGTATWSTGGETPVSPGADPGNGSGTGVTNRGDESTSNTYDMKQKVVQVDRLISTSYLDNFVDEKILINMLPILNKNIARSHARSVDLAILQGNGGNIAGLISMAVPGAVWGAQAADVADQVFSARTLVKSRRAMGVYGLEPRDVVFIISQDKYYDLLEDPDFQTIDEVGSDLAVRLTGQVGVVYGTPVVLTDNMPIDVEDGFGGGLCVNTSNFIIPRLRGVTLEQDYEVARQRRLLVGTQHLGFDELFASAPNKAAVTHTVYNALV